MNQTVKLVDRLLSQAREKIRSGQLGDAATMLSRALSLRPADPVLLHTLGLIACAQGDMGQGADHFRRAIAHRPDHPEAYGNLALALAQLGRLDDAVAAFRHCVALKPGVASPWINLGRALARLQQNDEAIASFERALAIDPAAVEALCGLGNALLQQGNVEDAISHYRRAVQLRPNAPETHFALGAASFVAGRLTDGIASCGTALAQDPALTAAAVNLGIYQRYACDWENFDTHQAMMRDQVRQGTGLVPPFAFLHVAATAVEQLQCARQVAEGPAMRTTHALSSSPRAPAAKIRLGYLSSDFRNHATAHLTAELFERHDRSRFDVVGYSLGADDGSAIHRRLIDGFDDFVDLGRWPVSAAAQRIHDDNIQVLVDLNGYAQNGRPQIMAMRPAPVQVNYLGYPGTMGARFVDYMIVDPVVVPSGQQPFFTERLVHLPECYQANDSRRAIAAVTPSRSNCGLPESGFVFCCFNNASKITPTIFDLWMRLLHAHPESVLWLLQGNALMGPNLRREAASRGIAPDRLVFAPPLPLAEHLARHCHADLFLDTLPYGAHTTMSDALWMALPAVTCLGDTFAGRVGGSLLRAVGLPDLVTESLVDYENLVLRLAASPMELAAARERLRRNRTTAPLFDTARFTRHIEAAYTRMWDICRTGAEPKPFAVALELSA